jgi:hypothetical protein
MIFDEEHLHKIEAQHNENPELASLLAQRDKLLKDHPQLRELQDEVDSLLGNTIDPKVRLEILFMLMTDKLFELKKVFAELMKLANTVKAGERVQEQRTV